MGESMSQVLVDMDGVVVDWGASYNRALDSWGSQADGISRHKDQRSFNLHEGLTFEEGLIVDSVMSTLDYSDMAPIDGAVETLHGMLEFGHDVMICTSPWLPNENCVSDKIKWIQYYLGPGWDERVIITKDKTVIKGDLLIDDKPVITGRENNPDWMHVIFDQPYNQEITSQPRLKSWADWDNERIVRVS